MVKLILTAFPDQTDFIRLENGEQNGGPVTWPGESEYSLKAHFYLVVGMEKATLQESSCANPG